MAVSLQMKVSTVWRWNFSYVSFIGFTKYPDHTLPRPNINFSLWRKKLLILESRPTLDRDLQSSLFSFLEEGVYIFNLLYKDNDHNDYFLVLCSFFRSGCPRYVQLEALDNTVLQLRRYAQQQCHNLTQHPPKTLFFFFFFGGPVWLWRTTTSNHWDCNRGWWTTGGYGLSLLV